MSDFLINLLSTIIGVAVGLYILFAGRKALWATLGLMSLIVAARFLALMVFDQTLGRELIEQQAWRLVGIAFAVGVIGMVLGRFKPDLAVPLIGFAAGADLVLWFYEIASYLIVTVAQLPEQVATIVGLAAIILGGLLGLWVMQKARDEALILVTMLVGVQVINTYSGLSQDSSWTTIIIIILALAGILFQYAAYSRERKASETEPKLHESSIAYFQDLELDA